MFPKLVESQDEKLQVSLFGDATKVPVRIQKADFKVFPVPEISQRLVKLSLTIVNDKCADSISAKLRMPLPVGASVDRFEFQREGLWYPAVPVEVKKAKEVVYKEREKGRDVAAASQVQGNVFEIEVTPLGHNKPTECRLWYHHAEALFPFAFDQDTEVTINGHPETEWKLMASEQPAVRACVGECFGEKHFACYVPFEEAEKVEAPAHIVVVWDTSRSQDAATHDSRFSRLRDLAAQCPGTAFDLWTFNMSHRQQVSANTSVEEVILALDAESHDGGTNLELLPPLFAQLDPSSVVMLFSDGMDSLNRCPSIPAESPKIHCVVDQTSANLRVLQSFCLATGGQVLTNDYTPVLRSRTLLTRIETDQDDAAFCGEGDSFQCCPDHRLQVQWPIESDGLWICGVLGSVSTISAEVQAGSLRNTILFNMEEALDVGTEAALLLGFLYAQKRYAAVERDGLAMGLDLRQIRAELVKQYGFCSPEASLMMLYEPKQFLENDIKCPQEHPAYASWHAEFVKVAGIPGNISDKKGDLGQPKTDQQMEDVRKLSKRLADYMANPVPKDFGGVKRIRGAPRAAHFAMMAGGGGGGASRGMRNSRCLSLGAGAFAEPNCTGSSDFQREAQCAAECADEEGMCCEDFCEDEVDREAQRDGSVARTFSSDLLDPASFLESLSAESRGRQPAPSGQLGEVRDTEAYVEGKEQQYLGELESALKAGSWYETYLKLRQDHGSSPSFFLYAASLILEHAGLDAVDDAVRVCTNCLEMNLQDVQMMRCVGYFLIKAGRAELALEVLQRIQDLAPVEPQSFLDGALALAFHMHHQAGKADEKLLRKAVELTNHAITHVWADRFKEVEWPALILLHLLVEIGEKQGIKNLWPLDIEGQRCPNFQAGLVVWLAWDTDNTDIDLHVIEPDGNEVYYSCPTSRLGGRLSKDFTQGYGPEVYLIKNPVQGDYKVLAKYYASHQKSILTGATSAVLWTIEGAPDGKVQFETIRLDRNKELMDVMTVTKGGSSDVKNGGSRFSGNSCDSNSSKCRIS